MKQLLAFGALMVTCAMVGAFMDLIRFKQAPHRFSQADANVVFAQHMQPVDTCAKWKPMDAHPNCHWERCPTVEDEMQMVCR